MERAITVRPMAAEDLDAVMEIQRRSPEASQWHRRDYEMVARGAWTLWRGWVAAYQAKVEGFLIARLVADELEILNLAVRPDARRSGVGASLLGESLGWGRAGGAAKAFLEVRASNQGALAFYERWRFLPTGRRPRYYEKPVEDALHLSASLV